LTDLQPQYVIDENYSTADTTLLVNFLQKLFCLTVFGPEDAKNAGIRLFCG